MEFDVNKYRHHYWFQKINEVPRASFNEKGISDFICNFAKEHDLKYQQDKAYNVFVFKPASKGAEKASPLILQAHMDMVPAKRPGSKHDFEKDPIELVEKDGWLYAKDTTLGADDGLGVAYMLTILEDDSISHPALECIFTVQEEVGLGGALAMKPEDIQADRMISLDSMNNDVADLCCAGGCYINAKKTMNMCDNSFLTYQLHIGGLQGGHSGADIHLEKGNANVIAVRILKEVMDEDADIHFVSMNCVSRSNAIPPETDIIFTSNTSQTELEKKISESSSYIKEELKSSDPNYEFTLNLVENAKKCADYKSTEELLSFMYICPNGFQHKSMAIEGLTVTSLNLGAISTNDNTISIQYFVRSMFESAVKDIANKIKICANIFELEYQTSDFFPGWEYEEISPIRDKFAKALGNHGKTLKKVAEHGGLEVGVFSALHPGLDITTVGAVCEYFHTFDERLNIESFNLGIEILKDILEQCTKD